MWVKKWCVVGTAASPPLVYPTSPSTGRAPGPWRIWGQGAPHAEAQGWHSAEWVLMSEH